MKESTKYAGLAKAAHTVAESHLVYLHQNLSSGGHPYQAAHHAKHAVKSLKLATLLETTAHHLGAHETAHAALAAQ
jgi:hypothetical protein